ncbi:MAG TPA: GLUG motif-containing protein [Spirochaetota bacterium]|nr:GLUG motif-containing protein [Spirochaetota bacterium]
MRIRRFVTIVIFTAAFAFAACDDDGGGSSPKEALWGVITLTGATAGTNYINIAWADPADADFDHVVIVWTLDSAAIGSITSVVSGTGAYTVSGLSTSSKYAVSLAASDETGAKTGTAAEFTITTTDTGTADYHFIYNAADLNAVRGGVEGYDDWGLDGNYIVMADFSLNVAPYNSGTGWPEIGSDGSPFTGTLDGNGRVIKNLYINDTSGASRGLFGCISEGYVHDLGLESIRVTGGAVYTGGLAGYVRGASVIEDCSVTGTLGGGSGGTGGAGGLAGQSNFSFGDDTVFTRCHAAVTVNGNGNSAGGLIGDARNTTMSDCYATGSVNGQCSCTGGLVGYLVTSTVTGCHATGTVTGTGWTGGLLGANDECNLTNCYATGNVSGSNETGGFAGWNFRSGISNSFSTGNVSSAGGYYTGGFAGTSTLNGTLTNCYAAGNVTASGNMNMAGGLVGRVHTGIITSCYAVGTVSFSGDDKGGITGDDYDSTYTSCFYDTETTGMSAANADFGTPATTVQMKTQATFTGASPAWNFTTVWAIDDTGAINSGYPYLIDNHL